jgi:hypothetical protein
MAALGCSAGPAATAASGQLPPATLSFYSEPGLHPPAVTVTRNPDGGSGDIFLTPAHSYQSGLMILDPSGQLVWFRPTDGWVANLEVQRYRGRPVLTWWQGQTPASVAEDVIADTSYRTVAVIQGGHGYVPDLHEFQITPQGTALIDVIATVKNYPLSSAGGPPRGSVANDIIQEVDIATGQVIWQWGALGHVPVTDSYSRVPASGPYDYFHLNSIQQLPDGNLLVSARDTSSVYLIDKQSGQILWTLGGKRSSFKLGSGASFHWQHDAHLANRTLTLFNDNWGGPNTTRSGASSAITLRLNLATMTATLVHRYAHSPAVTTGSEGSMETLPNGNVFVGWGGDPDFSEYTPGGSQIFNGNFALGVKSYRAYRFPWQAQPESPPALSVAPSSHRGDTVYASWNGATTVAAWRVLGGPSPGSLSIRVRQFSKSGFETAIPLVTSPRYVEVQALGSTGAVLGTSPVSPA